MIRRACAVRLAVCATVFATALFATEARAAERGYCAVQERACVSRIPAECRRVLRLGVIADGEPAACVSAVQAFGECVATLPTRCAAAASEGRTRRSAITGAWEGVYTCPQGVTGLALTVGDQLPDGRSYALFQFFPLEQNPDVGSGAFHMVFEPEFDSAEGDGGLDGVARFRGRPLFWTDNPDAYLAVDMVGEAQGGRFIGQVDSPGCGPFTLTPRADF